MRSYSVNELHEANDTGTIWGDAAFVVFIMVGMFALAAAFIS